MKVVSTFSYFNYLISLLSLKQKSGNERKNVSRRGMVSSLTMVTGQSHRF